MSREQPIRRSSHVEMPVAYAAVGASRAPDLLRFPPEGSTPYHEEQRLGSGQERFIVAASALMTWGAQRAAGIRITDIVRGADESYAGPSFDAAGTPEAAGALEEHFGPDGEPYIVAGTSAVLIEPGQEHRSVLVVYTLDEDRSAGFAWGTGDENGAVGEQLFFVEHREDDTVWAVARGFLTAPRSGLLGLKGRADLRAAIDSAKRQIGLLAPGAAPDMTPTVDAAANAEAAPEIIDVTAAREHVAAPEAAPTEFEDTETAVIVTAVPETHAEAAQTVYADAAASAEAAPGEQTAAGSGEQTAATSLAAAEPAPEPNAEQAPEAEPEPESEPGPEAEPNAEQAPEPEPGPAAEASETAQEDAIAADDVASDAETTSDVAAEQAPAEAAAVADPLAAEVPSAAPAEVSAEPGETDNDHEAVIELPSDEPDPKGSQAVDASAPDGTASAEDSDVDAGASTKPTFKRRPSRQQQ